MSASSSAPVSIVVMEGDGIGPEITAATLQVLRAADRVFELGLSFKPVSIGLAALASEASGQRGDSMVHAHSASEDARERADDTRPEPGSSARASLRAHGTTLPDAAVAAAKAADGVILGPVSHNEYPPAAQGGLNPSGELRKRLDLFANIAPRAAAAAFRRAAARPSTS
jgi:isocitrate/isopropylmalate dehydrogenase